MTLKLQPAQARGRYKNTWLDSRHTFSFGEFHDPAKLGFGDLRVLNQDTVAPGHGFGMHRHRDMEIVSWILEGKLRHEDSMGHSSVAGRGGVQRLTAGSGMAHGEFNDSQLVPVHFLQIWILPRREGIPPSYEAKQYSDEALSRAWVCIASPEGGDATQVDQDARIFVTRLKAGLGRSMDLPPKRRTWVHLALGGATLNGQALAAGDGAICEDEKVLDFKAEKDAEIVVFDLA